MTEYSLTGIDIFFRWFSGFFHGWDNKRHLSLVPEVLFSEFFYQSPLFDTATDKKIAHREHTQQEPLTGHYRVKNQEQGTQQIERVTHNRIAAMHIQAIPARYCASQLANAEKIRHSGLFQASDQDNRNSKLNKIQDQTPDTGEKIDHR